MPAAKTKPEKYPVPEYIPPPVERYASQGQPFQSSGCMDRLLPALAAARKEMGKLIKDKTNPHFNSGYASLEAVFDTYKPAFCKHGLAIIHTLDQEDAMTGTLFHVETGQWISSTMKLQMGRGGPQEQASATTYARRYIDCALVGLAPEDDDGNRAQTGHRTIEDVSEAPAAPQPHEQTRTSDPPPEAVSTAEKELIKTFITAMGKSNEAKELDECFKDIALAKESGVIKADASIKRLKTHAKKHKKRIDDNSLPGLGSEEVTI